MSGLIPETDAGHLRQAACNLYQASCDISEKAEKENRPSYIFVNNLKVFILNGVWCALLGEDGINGVAGYGKSPELAMQDFDKNWVKELA